MNFQAIKPNHLRKGKPNYLRKSKPKPFRESLNQTESLNKKFIPNYI